MSAEDAPPTGPARVVVVGASAGGIEALDQLVGRLPADLPAAVVVVVHVAPSADSVLPAILSRAGVLPATHAEDGQTLVAGTIVVAPPDRHVVLDGPVVRVTGGPRENGFRPAIDTTLRSAAHAFGDRAVGVVLSGMLDDGAYGLRLLRNAGGVGLVEDPETAQYPSMPESAIAAGGATFVAPLDELAAAIVAAVSGPAPTPEEVAVNQPSHDAPDDLPVDSTEIDGEIAPAVCPSCGGNLWMRGDDDDGPVQYRCRTGHRFSPESLLDVQSTAVDDALWGAYRALLERAEMSRRLAGRFEQRGLERSHDRWLSIAQEAEGRARVLRGILDREGEISGTGR